MMKKIGEYKITDFKIYQGQFTNIYTGYNPSGKNVAIKEVIQSQFVDTPISINTPLIKDLLQNPSQNLIELLHVEDQYPYFYFVCEMGDISLQKLLKKNVHNPYSDKEALYILTQIMMGYKFFYKKKIPYLHLNPSNIIKSGNKFKLLIPTTIFKELKKLNETDIDDQIFYFSPEQLQDQEINEKSDVWSLGCILYHMLYGQAPWEIPFPQKIIKNKHLSTIQMKKYLLMDYIQSTPLIFPNSQLHNYQISIWIMDLFKRIFVLDPKKRISFEEILNHKVIDYFQFLMKNQNDGQRYKPLKNTLERIVPKYDQTIIKSYVKKEQEKIKSDILKGYKSKVKKKNNEVPLEPMQIDVDDLSILQEFNKQTSSFKSINPLAQTYFQGKQPQSNDEIKNQIEEKLEEEFDKEFPEDIDPNLSIDQIKEQLIIFKERILLKIKAFEDIGRAIKSIYVVICKFFLLKQTLYEILKFEDKLIRDDNPFNFAQWQQFTKTQVYLKILKSLSNQKYRVYNILDNFYVKTEAVMKASKIQFSKEFLNYVNDDPFQKCFPVLQLLLNGTLQQLTQQIKEDYFPDSKLIKMKFAILIQIILFTEQTGIFENIPRDLEYAQIYKTISTCDNMKQMKKYFDDIIQNKNDVQQIFLIQQFYFIFLNLLFFLF